jgi:hypothetical protein
MKNTVFAVATLISLCSAVYGANTLEIERNVSAEVTKIKLCLERPISGQLGLAAYGEITEGWAQAYAGPSIKVSDNLNGWIGLGIQNSGETRYGGALWAGKGKISLLYLYSGGGNAGPWHESYLGYRITSKVTCGLVENTGKGVGGRIDYKINNFTQLRFTTFTKSGEKNDVASLRVFF